MTGMTVSVGLPPVVNSENISDVLQTLALSLTEAQDELERTECEHKAVLEQFRDKLHTITAACTKLESEYESLLAVNPLAVLERRKNDSKTESDYIGKILQRDIHQEFVSMLKGELKGVVNSMTQVDPAHMTEGLEHISGTFAGCSVHEALLAAHVHIIISAQTDRLLTLMAECAKEVCAHAAGKMADFAEFCVKMITTYFGRLRDSRSVLWNLPQFLSLFINDCRYATVFIFSQFERAVRRGICVQAQKALIRLLQEQLAAFKQQQKDELNMLLLVHSIAELERSDKKIALYFSRLNKILKPIMLPSERLLLLNELITHVLASSWKFICSLDDIDEVELPQLSTHCKFIGGEFLDKVFTEERKRTTHPQALKHLECAQLTSQSLSSIINSHLRHEYSAMTCGEVSRIIESVFAHSPLKREFLSYLQQQ